MFDFQKLKVYQKSKGFYSSIRQLTKRGSVDYEVRNQIRRASLSVICNIAEGTGRKTGADQRRFMVIARGSVFECAALLDVMHDQQIIDAEEYSAQYEKVEELSKMLFGMIRNLG